MKKTFKFGIRAIQGIAHKIAKTIEKGGFKGDLGRTRPDSQRHIAHRRGLRDSISNHVRVMVGRGMKV